MGIRDLDIKISYVGKGDVILKDFLLPIIKESVSYDRVTSFYTVESLLAISQGIQSLYEKKGKMRLIIGMHSFPAELIEAEQKKNYLKDQIKKINQDIIAGIRTIEDALRKERLATIAWMIQDGLLEIKAAAVKGAGIFHPKTLILKDENADTIVAIGSPNETGNGLGANYEQIIVVKSWESSEGVVIQEQFFDSLWNNTDENAIVIDISEETALMIKDAIGENYYKKNPSVINGIIDASSKMPTNYFVSGDIPALYMHQERAVMDALSRWPVRVLFSDEVGLGKTFEVAATMVFLIKYCCIKRIIILTPEAVLKQWQEELYDHFSIDAWLYDSGSKMYVSAKGKTRYIGKNNPIGKKSPDIILMSAQFARGNKKNGSLFELSDSRLPDLLVVDEAHSARVTKSLDGSTKKTRMYNMLESIARKIPHLILATATPMQKDAEEYHAMLKLLGLPDSWGKLRNYMTSLRLIESPDVPDTSDASNAGRLMLKTLEQMRPSLEGLDENEIASINGLLELKDNEDHFIVGQYVQKNWNQLYPLFIKLHPAHLLTIRNTRKSLEQVGYKFPKRNLIEISIENSIQIQLFYEKVDCYLTNDCFSIEELLYPDNRHSIGFVRISYQQRVASSLYSCKKSLERRVEKIHALKELIESNKNIFNYKDFSNDENLDDLDADELFRSDEDILQKDIIKEIDFKSLHRAIGIEETAVTSLVKEANTLLDSLGDMKIKRAVQLAEELLEKGETVLLFSRYTDTVDALLNEYRRECLDKKYVYGIYTGQIVSVIESGKEYPCDKGRIKSELFSGHLKIMFCSDAASEGLNLQAARILINVDVPWTPARLEQRIGRIARLGQVADEVDIYNVWYPYSVEAHMYHRIQKRLEETNLAIGEFPEVMADNIKAAVLEGIEDDKNGKAQLNAIRNACQIEALEKLWSENAKGTTTSKFIREILMKLCCEKFECIKSINEGRIKTFLLPDKTIENLTSVEGMAESISLKSKPWEYVDYYNSDYSLLYGINGIPAVFAIEKNGKKLVKHEAILESLLGKKPSINDLLHRRPQMLANTKRIDLSYSTDVNIENAPEMWIEGEDER